MRKTARRAPVVCVIEFLFLCAAAVVLLRIAYPAYYRVAYPVRYTQTIQQECENNALPVSLVYAVIRTESGFHPDVQSSVSARGLMQITQDTFEWAQYRTGEEETLCFDDLFDTGKNIQYGTAILRLLIDEFGTYENALCAYHAGWGNAKKWLADPEYAPDGVHIETIPFQDTARYVKQVIQTKNAYESIYQFDEN